MKPFASRTMWTWGAVVGWMAGPMMAAISTQPAITPRAVRTETLPITEVTVFKDGHAFVLREASVPVDEAGTVVLDDLPAPVLGTFWPYVAQTEAATTGGSPGVILRQVVAGKREVVSERPVVNIRDLLEANVGAEVQIHEVDGHNYTATIVDVLNPAAEPAVAAGVPPLGSPAPSEAKLVLLRVHEQIKAVPIDRIRDVTFRQEPKRVSQTAQSRGVLTLSLSSAHAQPLRRARIGLMYLQKGLRWIPNYKVELDGNGQATVKLQATLINELADLKDARLQLVVGVPTFAFKDTLDPMSLQESVAQLGRHFRPDSQTAFAFSNAIMSQAVAYEPPTPAASGAGLGPEVPEGTQREDLFIFTLDGVTLAKGQRMVVPVAEYSVSYKDVYVLELGFAPPPEVPRNLHHNGQQDAARLMNQPKVMHKLRLTNKTVHPFTTAPALIVQQGRALAQGMMAYTPVGGASDLELTVAVNVRAKKSESETHREPNAMHWRGVNLARIDLSGTVSIVNSRSEPIDMEVVRSVLGSVDHVGQGGKAEQTGAWEDAWGPEAHPEWWQWHAWPWWWHSVNGLGQIRWDVHLKPGEKTELSYSWHYFWG